MIRTLILTASLLLAGLAVAQEPTPAPQEPTRPVLPPGTPILTLEDLQGQITNMRRRSLTIRVQENLGSAKYAPLREPTKKVLFSELEEADRDAVQLQELESLSLEMKSLAAFWASGKVLNVDKQETMQKGALLLTKAFEEQEKARVALMEDYFKKYEISDDDQMRHIEKFNDLISSIPSVCEDR